MTDITKERLTALIQANLLSANAYLEAAQLHEDPQFKAKLRAWSRERMQQARKLQRALLDESGLDNEVGAWLDGVVGAFDSVRQGILANNIKRMLSSAASSETYLQKMYELLLSVPDVIPLSKELRKQYAQVRAMGFNVRRLSG